MMLAAIFAALFSATNHTVTFTAKATGVQADVQLEFVFVGPNSDRDYEALFMLEDPLEKVVAECEKAGFPMGQPYNPSKSSFWPVGVEIKVTPDIWEFMKDSAKDAPRLPAVWTGGLRDSKNFPVAATNMPAALFSTYSCDQAALLFDDALDQSTSYGRFTPTKQLEKDKVYTFTLSWSGAPRPATIYPTFAPTNLTETFAALRKAPAGQDLTPVFSPDLSVREAQAVAAALATLDSRALRINSAAPGQFFYRGFMPLEKWRDRQQRLSQPLEVRFGTNTTFTVIEEDWTVEGDDPKLTPREIPLAEVATKFKGNTCFFYAPKTMKLEKIFDCMKTLPKTIRNWYVYGEE